MTRSLESATLFTPGRASYLDERGDLQLTEASVRRGQVAAAAFSAEFHDGAVFAGGYPGLAQNWAAEHIPPTNRREAQLMGAFLLDRLNREGWTPEQMASVVHLQGDSNNSIGDVALSVEKGLLDPDFFNNNIDNGIDLTTGVLHGTRFKSILSKALDIDPKRIQRLGMRDIYGTPEFPTYPAESRQKAVAKEIAAIAITEYVLRPVQPGDLQALFDAEQHFTQIAKRLAA